jgi:tripartite-type tricarboxylate transporter receptor subunit TctC
MSISRRAFTSALVGATLAGTAMAQDNFPSKPIHMVVPYPPGGSTDILARAVAQQMGVNMGVSVIIDNRAGASGTMGTDYIARAEPDGYTIGVSVPGTLTLPVALSRKTPYDPIASFTPLSILATNPLAIVVPANLPVNSLSELVAYARKNPNKLSYGTSGAGTSEHLVGEMLNQFAKISIVHVPYKGGSSVLNDLLGGQIQVGYVVIATVLPHVKAGRLKMLAVIGEARYSELPNVPTNHEALPGFEPKTSWVGAIAPAKLPPAIAARLTAELQKAVRNPKTTKYLNAAGLPVVGSNGEAFAARIREDIAAWTPIVKAGNITVD